MRQIARLTVGGVVFVVTAILAGCKDSAQPTRPDVPGAPLLTAGSGIASTTLVRGTIDPFHIQSDYEGHRVQLKSHDPSVIQVGSATLAPGGSTGWHSHSGPVIVTVKAGALSIYRGNDDACRPTVHVAGTAFIESGGLSDVHIGRNEGTTTVEWVALSILPVGVAGRIDVPAPGNCPF